MNKPDDDTSTDKDVFWLRELYPDAGATLSFSQAPVEAIRDDCIIILDANVLLLPYRLGATSLVELDKLYNSLAKGDRIFLPAQAVREFLKNRANRIRDLLRELSTQASQIHIVTDRKIGFLEGDEDYSSLVKLSDEVKAAKTETLKTMSKISDKLRNGVGIDPVSRLYQKVFSGRVVELDKDQSDEELLQEMRWRYDHSIPPGYKDRNKADEGIGDLIIWKVILQLGSKRKANCIFVTEDAKSDWWVQSEGIFQPRLELVEEYRRHSDGKTIHLMPLSSLLELLGAEPDAVDEAKKAEEARRQRLRDLADRARVRLAASTLEEPETSEGPSDLDRTEMTSRLDALTTESRTLLYEKANIDRLLRDADALTSLSEEEIADLFRKRDDLEIRRRDNHRARRRLDDAMRSYFIKT